MTDETKDQLTRFMDNMNSAMEGGADFVLEQAPLVIQEIVVWGRVEHTTWVALSMVILTAAVVLLKKSGLPYCAGIKQKQFETKQEGCYTLVWTAFIVVTIGSAATFAINLTLCLKAWFAPRLYVIEYIADAIK